MKLVISLFIMAFALTSPLFAQDEGAKVDLLIQATEENLVRLKTVKELLADYKKAETIALKNEDDTDNLVKLVALAQKLQTQITDCGLQDYFSPQFLEELKKFSKLAEKKYIPKPK